MKTMSFPSASIGNPEMSKPGPPIKALEGDKNTSQIIRDLIIPQLTKEINEGKNFTQLRQVYNSLILATWYKKKISAIGGSAFGGKDSILSQVYIDKNKVAGISIDNPQEKQNIYERYLKAFKKGAYNYIKEEQDPVSRKMLPRKYFSGGVNVFGISKQLDTTGQFDTSSSNPNLAIISVLLSQDEARHHSNQAMTNVEERIRQAATIIDQEIKVHGLKNFRLLERLSSQYGEEMNVYEFNGFKIIKKEFWLEDVRVIQELSQAKKSAIVPLFFTNEFPKSYFELDLRDFGYVSFFDTSTKWVTADTLKRIRDLYKATFRSDNHIWFQHGHLHMKNILVKFSEDGGIDDFKFIDFKVLEKVNVDTNPLLMAIRDGKKLNSIRQDFVDGVSLEWMELDGFDFSSLNFTAQAFIGSSLVKAIFHKSRLDSVSFELADLTEADFSDASIQDESTSFLYANMKDVDVAGASFDFPELLAYSLKTMKIGEKIGDSAQLIQDAAMQQLKDNLILEGDRLIQEIIAGSRDFKAYQVGNEQFDGLKHLIVGELDALESFFSGAKIKSERYLDVLRTVGTLEELFSEYADYSNRVKLEQWANEFISIYDSEKGRLVNLYDLARMIKSGQFTQELADVVNRLRIIFDKNKVRIKEITKYLSMHSQDNSAMTVKNANVIPLELGNDQAIKGGIDFNSDKMNLETKVDSRLRGNDKGREGILFHMDPAQLKQLQDSPGFAPIIIDIQPMMDLPKFLGVKSNSL